MFKEDEKRAGMKHDAFNSLIPKCVESPEHEDIISNFFLLLVSLAAAEKRNGLNGHKLARLAGAWAFELVSPKKEAPSNFADGLSCWSVAAEACYHLFLAFLRTMYPLPGENRVVTLPKSLESLLLKEQYPPKPLYKSRLITVPKITLSVGRLSANPFVLLQRVAKTIQFENPEKFSSEDDFSTLYFLFSDINEIENRMSPESKRILEEISKENTIFSDHPLKIKDTIKLPYDVRAKTWSKFYNHAYIDPVTGEPHRPLTNYVYEDHQREMILQSSLPKAERAPLPYPDSPTLSSGKDKPIRIGTWNEVLHYYAKSTEDKRYQTLENWNKQRQISTDSLATCTLSNIAIDDFFVWVWISSLSSEQTEVSKAVFGRSVVVELQLDNGEAGRRWVVVEEILHPKPSPMKPKPKANEPVQEAKKAIKAAKVEKSEKKPVRFSEPPTKSIPILSPRPTKPHNTVSMPSSEPKERTIHIRYDNLDPLVAAVAERLKIHNVDHGTQTDEVESVQTNQTPPAPTSISADDGNSKGTQTYNYVSAATSTEHLGALAPTSTKSISMSSTGNAEVQSIYVSPKLSGEPSNNKPENRPKPSSSYEDVINAIPYLNVINDDYSDCMVTPILSSSALATPPVTEPLSKLVISKKRSMNRSPLANEENFVTSIDTAHSPDRRVVSMPVFPDRTLGGFEQSVDSSTDRIDLHHSGYRALLEESDEESITSRPMLSMNPPPPLAPASNYRSHQRSQSSLESSHRSVSLGGLGAFPTSISSSERENPAAMQVRRKHPEHHPLPQPLPRPAQVQDEGLFDRSSGEFQRGLPQSMAPQSRPPRATSPASDSSSGSNLRGNWGYGRNSNAPPQATPMGGPIRENPGPSSWAQGESQALPMDQRRRDPRDPRAVRDYKNDPRGQPMMRDPRDPRNTRPGPMRDSRQIPRDFQQNEFDPAVPRGYPRPAFANSDNGGKSMSPPRNRYRQFGELHDSHSESALPKANTNFGLPSGNHSGPSGLRGPALPTVDDMMMDSGPMPGGIRSTVSFNKPRLPNHNAFVPPGNRQAIPTMYHSSPDSFKEFGYGSDSNYRYDPSERPKASPDSGFANPPGLNRRPVLGSSSNGSDSDASRSSNGQGTLRARSNSNRDFGLPPPNLMGNRHQRHASNPEGMGGSDQQHQISPQFRPVSEIKAPQPRSSIAAPLFAESPLKSVSTSSSTIREAPPGVRRVRSVAASVLSGTSSQESQHHNISSSLPRAEPIAAPPVVSAINVSSAPHSFQPSGSTAFENRPTSMAASSSPSGSLGSDHITITPPLNIQHHQQLPAVIETNVPPPAFDQSSAEHSKAIPVRDSMAPSHGASSDYSEGRESEGSARTDDFATGFVPSQEQTRDLFDYSPPRPARQPSSTSASRNVSPNFPDPVKFDPLNEQSIMRATKLNLLGPDPSVSSEQAAAVAAAQDLQATSSTPKKYSRLSIQGILDATKKLSKK